MLNVIARDELFAELHGPCPPVLIEALGGPYFADAHLPGAINIPPALVDRLVDEAVPDRATSIVVYCSRSSRSSQIVARRLLELGYPHVRVYPDGKEDWVEHGLPVDRSGNGD